jgi:hypothetical protein
MNTIAQKVLPWKSYVFEETVDKVEQQTASQVDAAGNPVEVWVTTATNLACAIHPGEPEDFMQWQQMGIRATHRLYFPPGADGSLPPINNRCRLQHGTHADGSPRYFAVRHAFDVAEKEVLFNVIADEMLPGGTV